MQLNIDLTDKNSESYLSKQVNMARYALILLVFFTVLNLVLLFAADGRYILFSAAVPYYMTWFAQVIDYNYAASYTLPALACGVVIIILYCVCGFMSLRKTNWLLPALVMAVVDTAVLLFLAMAVFGIMNCIIELFIHAWIIWQLWSGYRCGQKL